LSLLWVAGSLFYSTPSSVRCCLLASTAFLKEEEEEEEGRERGREGGKDEVVMLDVEVGSVKVRGREGGREGGRIELTGPINLPDIHTESLPPPLPPALPPSLLYPPQSRSLPFRRRG
jgi:hypothetical protein